jgi:hydroxymethylglutaryl-CoA lyase
MKLIECPRDAMQGLTEFISTEKKINYINQLLKVGFNTIDFGSFVSAKAIPQLSDTKEVLSGLDLSVSTSTLLAIVANVRGAEEASTYQAIEYLGFPLSISETFQKRNTNASIAQAIESLAHIQSICESSNKKLVTYISMGFGNPYNDPYSIDVVKDFVEILVKMNVSIISLADTIGVSTPEQIKYLFPKLIEDYRLTEFGVHLHSSPTKAKEKIQAAYQAGCHRFDGALKGWGGCPMADDELVGNLATEKIIDYLESRNVQLHLNKEELVKAMIMADEIFINH